MSQKKISQYYIFSLVWTIFGIRVSLNAEGAMQTLYILSAIACAFCSVEFLLASENKKTLFKISIIMIFLVSICFCFGSSY